MYYDFDEHADWAKQAAMKLFVTQVCYKEENFQFNGEKTWTL